MWSRLDEIPSGARGLEQKMATIRGLVEDAKRDPGFRARVMQVVGHLGEKDSVGEIGAVTRWVQDRIRYVRDPVGVELFTAPDLMLSDIERGRAAGDCDDHVILASAMLETLGYPTRYKVGAVGPQRYRHVWLEVDDPRRGWLPVELTRTHDPAPVGWDPASHFPVVETYTGGPAARPAFWRQERTPQGAFEQLEREIGLLALLEDIAGAMGSRAPRASVWLRDELADLAGCCPVDGLADLGFFKSVFKEIKRFGRKVEKEVSRTGRRIEKEVKRTWVQVAPLLPKLIGDALSVIPGLGMISVPLGNLLGAKIAAHYAEVREEGFRDPWLEQGLLPPYFVEVLEEIGQAVQAERADLAAAARAERDRIAFERDILDRRARAEAFAAQNAYDLADKARADAAQARALAAQQQQEHQRALATRGAAPAATAWSGNWQFGWV